MERGGQLALEIERWVSRGIWVLSRGELDYPSRLRKVLKDQSPPILFGMGDRKLLATGGIAIIGSRNIDEQGAEFAQLLAEKCVKESLTVISGGARGTDKVAMRSALESGGHAIGVLADSLERVSRGPEIRAALSDGRLVLVTQYLPDAGFSVGVAMGRNKIIYGLADYAVVVASEYEKGGTWSGAVDALKNNWCPVFVRQSETVHTGNRELLKKGGVPLPEAHLKSIESLSKWIAQAGQSPSSLQGQFFQPLLGPVETQQDVPAGLGTSVEGAAPPVTDLFELAWPHLSRFLNQPRTSEEIQKAFCLETECVNGNETPAHRV